MQLEQIGVTERLQEADGDKPLPWNNSMVLIPSDGGPGVATQPQATTG